jgi:hypothetical protein
MKITHVKLGQLQTPNSHGKRLVTICATLDNPKRVHDDHRDRAKSPGSAQCPGMWHRASEGFRKAIRGPVFELLPDTGRACAFAGGLKRGANILAWVSLGLAVLCLGAWPDSDWTVSHVLKVKEETL